VRKIQQPGALSEMDPEFYYSQLLPVGHHRIHGICGAAPHRVYL